MLKFDLEEKSILINSFSKSEETAEENIKEKQEYVFNLILLIYLLSAILLITLYILTQNIIFAWCLMIPTFIMFTPLIIFFVCRIFF